MAPLRLVVALVLTALAVTTCLGVVAPGAAAASGAPPTAWKRAAAKLPIPIYWPTKTFGLRIDWVNPILADPGCANDGRSQLRAFYHADDGRFLELYEGHPRYCTDNPIVATVVSRPLIHGKRAALYRIRTGRLALEWCEKGTTITLVGDGLSKSRVIAIGRSMRVVQTRPARACVLESSRSG